MGPAGWPGQLPVGRNLLPPAYEGKTDAYWENGFAEIRINLPAHRLATAIRGKENIMKRQETNAIKAGRAIAVIVCMLAGLSAAQDDTFEQRAQNIINASANTNINWRSFQSVKFSALKASALFAKGRDSDAFSILNNIYKGMAIKNFEDPEMPLWSLMDTYYRWKDKFSQRDIDALKAFINADIIDGDKSAGTPNHYWMMAAGLLLANQHWGEGEMRYTYDKPGGVEGWIKNKLTEIVHYGYHEYNSDTYMALNVGPILTVADFAEDPMIRKMARMTVDWMLINAASSRLDGHYAAATKRTYAMLQRNNNALAPSDLFFGGHRNTGGLQLPFALSSYRVPGVVFQIANDRAEPFHLQSAHYTQPNLSNKLNSWITPEYAVYSQYEVNNDLGPKDHMSFELDRWGVKWTDANSGRYSHFAVQHPHPKRGEDYMGGTLYEQMLHDKNTVISAYNIPKNRPAEFSEEYWRPYISGHMANTELAKIDEMNNGRLFLYFKEVMIGMAFLPRKSVTLNRATQYYHFRINVTDNYLTMGLLVEAADPDDYPGSTNSQKLSAFRDACTKAFDKAVYTSPGGKPVIEYVNLGGVHMKLAWAERKTLPLRQINGVDVPNLDKRHEGWLIKSPWVKQKIGHDHLYVSHGGDRRIYDFGAWSIDSTSNWNLSTGLEALNIP